MEILPKDIVFDAYVLHIGFNKNGHYFSNDEVAKSYKTLINQPINIDHNHNRVIGKITNAIFIVDDGVVITSEVKEELAKQVIGDPDYIIALSKIEAGAYRLSMECIPADIDIVVADLEHKKLYRLPVNDDTVILLSCIPHFGGTGFIGSTYRVGVLLKNIKFIGAALVDRPADPQARIVKIYKQVAMEDSVMKQNDNVQEIKELQDQLKEKEDVIAELEAKNQELEAQVQDLESQLSESGEVIESKTRELEEASQKIEEAEKQISDLTAQISKLEETITSLRAENEKLSTDLTLAKRKHAVSELNVEITDEELLAFTDESFDVFVETVRKLAESQAKEEEIEVDISKAEFKSPEGDGLPENTNDDLNYEKLIKELNKL